MDYHPRAAALALAIAERDHDRLGEEVTEDVRLRALLPGGSVEVHGRNQFLGAFREWFRDYTTILLDEASGEEVGDRLVVHYRLIFEPAEERRILTQTWVATVKSESRLARVDLLCSGFRRF